VALGGVVHFAVAAFETPCRTAERGQHGVCDLGGLDGTALREIALEMRGIDFDGFDDAGIGCRGQDDALQPLLPNNNLPSVFSMAKIPAPNFFISINM
jgi:hypothetical protein